MRDVVQEFPLILADDALVAHPAASYFDALVKQRQERGVNGAFLSWNDLQATVSQVNAQVQEETDRTWSLGLGEFGPPLGAPSLSHQSGPSAHLDLFPRGPRGQSHQ